MQTKSDQDLVKDCMTELCRQAGFLDINSMVQRDYEFLSEQIESKTGIVISLSTIKRLLNGQFTRIPQIATLNAISNFIGYTNWQDYKTKSKMMATAPQSLVSPTMPVMLPHAKIKFPFQRVILIGSAIMLSLLLLISTKHTVQNTRHASFSITHTNENNLPNTVIFHYNVDSIDADSFAIQQSWNKARRRKIFKHQYIMTDIYYEPGYHVAKLFANDQIIRTLDVSIPTDRWIFYAKEEFGSIPQYIKFDGIQGGALKISPEQVKASLVNTDKDQFYVMTYFPANIKDSSDNFIMKCRARTHPVKNNACPFMMYEIFAQRNFTYFISNARGCAHTLGAQFGDVLYKGDSEDMSALCSDVLEWNDIEFIVKARKVTIRMNGKEVFHTQYHESNGLITGLGFISNGLPEIDYIDFKALGDVIVYNNNFE